MKVYYKIGEGDEGWDCKLLVGPDNFACYMGEPEDCNWARDGMVVVKELNKLKNELEKLKEDLEKFKK